MRKVAEALAKDVAFFWRGKSRGSLRSQGLERDVLLLGLLAPLGAARSGRARLHPHRFQRGQAREFAGGRVNFKIDTGMGRIGCWQDDARRGLATIANAPGLSCTAFLPCLPPTRMVEFTLGQLENFAALSIAFRRLAPGARIHALNSGGILEFPGHAHDLVRPGLMLYGSAYPARHQDLLRPLSPGRPACSSSAIWGPVGA